MHACILVKMSPLPLTYRILIVIANQGAGIAGIAVKQSPTRESVAGSMRCIPGMGSLTGIFFKNIPIRDNDKNKSMS